MKNDIQEQTYKVTNTFTPNNCKSGNRIQRTSGKGVLFCKENTKKGILLGLGEK